MQYDMAPQEIINELNKIKPHTDGVNDVGRRDFAIEAAKDALKKQIPQKVKVHSVPTDSPFAYGKKQLDYLVCPACIQKIQVCFTQERAVRPPFCCNCGQALDWTGGQDEN